MKRLLYAEGGSEAGWACEVRSRKMAESLGNGDGKGPLLVGSPKPPRNTTPSSWPKARCPVRL